MSPESSLFRRINFRHGLAALLAPLGAIASEAPPPPPGVSFSTVLQTFAGLALVLALFVGAAWLARKMNGGKVFMSGSGPLRAISSLAVGPRERIVLIEIEGTWLVVGVAPGRVSTLHTLPKGTLPLDSAAEGQFVQFGHWLKQFRDQRHDAKE